MAKVDDQTKGTENAKTISSYSVLASTWEILRLPALLLIFLVFRRPIQGFVVEVFDLSRATLFIINVLSTPVCRAIYFAVSSLTLLLCAFTSRSLGRAYLITSFVGIILFVGACIITSRSILFAVPAIAMLTCNLAPSNITSSPASHLNRRFLVVAIGVSEVLFFWRHVGGVLFGLLGKTLPSLPRWQWALPGIVISTAASAVLLNGSAFVPYEQALRSSPNVQILAGGDFNWIQLDATEQFLFATGHGLDRIRRYRLADNLSSFIESEVSANSAQDFAYDPTTNEIYVYNDATRQLLCLDGETLKLKRSTPLPDVSPGDAWLAVDPTTKTIVVASEADEQTGTPFYVVDQFTGKVISDANIEAGSLLIDSKNSIAYLNYFRRKRGVLIYDLKRGQISKEASLPSNSDRMVLRRPQNELLISLPIESRIARLDADTLQMKGSISTVFGVRTIALDEASNMLLSGSLATGMLEVLDVSNGRRLASFFLGPWLRTIELVPGQNIAYVSSNGAIYKVRYK
jgi:DNA-binding beta-propeller fold protein YncE